MLPLEKEAGSVPDLDCVILRQGSFSLPAIES